MRRIKTGDFRYLRTITNSLSVAKPIKMHDLHKSTSWVILMAIRVQLHSSIFFFFFFLIQPKTSVDLSTRLETPGN